MNTTQTTTYALANGRDKYYARPVVRFLSGGDVEVRLPGGNGKVYEAGTYTLIEK